MFFTIKKTLSLLEKKEKKQFLKLIICMFFASALEILGLASIFPLINFLTNQETTLNLFNHYFADNYMIYLVCLIFIIYLLKNIFLSFYYWLENTFAYNTRFNLGVRLYSGYLNSPYKFHLENNSSVLITKIVQETSIFGSAIISLSSLITEIMVVSGITLLLIIMKPQETFYVIIIISTVSLIFYYLTKKISSNLGKLLVEEQKNKMRF